MLDRRFGDVPWNFFLSIACPTPYRIVLTTNYVGYTGGLRIIEDIYNTALATYK